MMRKNQLTRAALKNGIYFHIGVCIKGQHGKQLHSFLTNDHSSKSKMARVIAVLLLVTAMVFVANAQQRCPANQEYKECGTPCPPSCAQPSPFCAAVCVARCQCKSGFLLNARGNCVRPNQC